MKLVVDENRDRREGAEIGRLLGGQMLRALIESSANKVTGVPGFSMFFYQISEIRQTHSENYHIIFFDIDGLKRVNDHFGHGSGDQLLRALARALKTFFLREYDAICHYAGDEFIVYDGRTDSLLNVLEHADATRRMFLTFVQHLGLEADVSFGVARGCDASYRSLQAVIDKADTEMYMMKKLNHDRNHPEKARSLVRV